MKEATKSFFKAEIHNEDNGGISPSNLYSALDSLEQYPKHNFVVDFGISKLLMKQRLNSLIKKYGKRKLLRDFL